MGIFTVVVVAELKQDCEFYKLVDPPAFHARRVNRLLSIVGCVNSDAVRTIPFGVRMLDGASEQGTVDDYWGNGATMKLLEVIPSNPAPASTTHLRLQLQIPSHRPDFDLLISWSTDSCRSTRLLQRGF